jgi:hypothetical protein
LDNIFLGFWWLRAERFLISCSSSHSCSYVVNECAVRDQRSSNSFPDQRSTLVLHLLFLNLMMVIYISQATQPLTDDCVISAFIITRILLCLYRITMLPVLDYTFVSFVIDRNRTKHPLRVSRNQSGGSLNGIEMEIHAESDSVLPRSNVPRHDQQSLHKD